MDNSWSNPQDTMKRFKMTKRRKSTTVVAVADALSTSCIDWDDTTARSPFEIPSSSLSVGAKKKRISFFGGATENTNDCSSFSSSFQFEAKSCQVSFHFPNVLDLTWICRR